MKRSAQRFLHIRNCILLLFKRYKKGAISYKIPVSITGSVVTKQAASYTNRPASFLKTQNLTEQEGTINYGYYSDTKIYVKELNMNEAPPAL